MGKLRKVSSNPHVRSSVTTSNIMIWVLIALLPATGYGIYNFGIYTMFVIGVSVAACVVSELVYEILLRKRVTIGDFTAVVTGLLLALNMPPEVPLWVPALGGVFAIIMVKQLFGGLGQNFMNPALGARSHSGRWHPVWYQCRRPRR